MKFRCSKCGYTGDGPDFPHSMSIDGRDCRYVAAIDRLANTPLPSPEAEALPTLPVVAWRRRYLKPTGAWTHLSANSPEAPLLNRELGPQETEALTPHAPAEAAIMALRAEVERLNLLVMQGADGRAEAAHAELYYRQAEALLTANERTLHAEVAELRKERDAAAQDLSSLRAFVGEVMGDWPDVGGLDGFDLQGIGEKTGLLRRETRVAPCGEQCACVEFDSGEVECWRVEPVLQRARASLLGDGGTL